MESKKAFKRVLLLGSGLMTPALVDYLVQFKDTHITVASNLIKEAEGIAARHPEFIKAALVDIFNVRLIEFE
jgi:saccharopine dehydrogenase-like NADP-dependent oxidoreductase